MLGYHFVYLSFIKASYAFLLTKSVITNRCISILDRILFYSDQDRCSGQVSDLSSGELE